MVEILDCSTRDGGYCTNWCFSDEYIYNLMSVLNKNNVTYYEIGYRNYYEREGKGDFYYCTPDIIKKFYLKKEKLNLGVMVDTKRYNKTDFNNGKSDYIDFVRIATHPENIEKTIYIAESLYKKNYTVMIQLMDMSNLCQKHLRILEQWRYKDILRAIYLADTYGVINPDDVPNYYNKLLKAGYKNIGFHGHNNSGQALSNSLKAMDFGAYSIDVTQDGKGINGGNLSHKELIKYL